MKLRYAGSILIHPANPDAFRNFSAVICRVLTAELYRLYLSHPSVQIDTRKLRGGDIFFALKGPSFNGNAFAAAALNAGASYAVIDEKEFQADERYVLVPDVLQALQDLAAYHRTQFNIPFIAITGSNGKTTTKELLTSVLRQKFRTYATQGNFNNHIGVPLTILSIHKDAEMAVVEMGANHRHEIEQYCLLAQPTHGLITNCGKAHIEGFGSEEGVRKGKGELYDFIRKHGGSIFRNADLDYLESMAQGIKNQISYGSEHADFCGKAVMEGIFLNVELLTTTGLKTFKTNLAGAYNFSNVMAAIAVALSFGIDIEDIAAALKNYTPDNSRSQWLQRGENKIILDAYNANPTSMKAAIESYAATDLPAKRLWLGAMKEMGGASLQEHESLLRLVRKFTWEEVVLVGDEFLGLQENELWFATATAAADYVRAHQPSQASILIKGSRGSKMELLLEALPA